MQYVCCETSKGVIPSLKIHVDVLRWIINALEYESLSEVARILEVDPRTLLNVLRQVKVVDEEMRLQLRRRGR